MEVANWLEQLLWTKFVESNRLAWLGQHEQGQGIDQMTVQRHAWLQDAAFAWKGWAAMEQPPFIEERLVLSLPRK